MECGPNEPTLFNFENNSTRQFIHSLVLFQKAYAPIHGRICVFLCLFGVITNLIHCVVLTRPQMRQSAVNSIMTAVALCDLGTMGSYLIYIWHFVLGGNLCSNTQTHIWMYYLLLHIFLSIVLHTATLWLAVLMAFLRRMTLHRNTLYSKWQRVALARRASLTVIFFILLLCIPSLAVHQVIKYPHANWHPSLLCPKIISGILSKNHSEPIFTIIIRNTAMANGCWLFKANLWLTGICFKVIPCLLLLILSASLLQRLKQAEKKRCQLLLKQLSDSPKNDGRNSVDNLKQRQNGGIKKMHADRTTGLLLAILCVFLLTELPQGLIAILNAIYTADVHRFIYLTLGDVLDLLSLINSSVNFVLYCLMSSRYRQTFCSLFLPIKICGRCVANGGQSAPPLQSFVSEKQFNDNCDELELRGTLAQRLAQRRRSTPTLRLQRVGSQQSHLSMRDWKERQQKQRRGSNFPKYLGEKIREDSNDENKQQTNLLTPNAGF
uniref:G-protein coupled receptors family 1 profile domain-containing protein n=1 Tax=Meloidogyne enterolobii TaxID=390850 RepID=A0A6V7XFF2_MELEN|nr:unnamed protein product [Meloidogyne enterolobii]